MFSSVYVITNSLNNKKYVGQSVNVEKRWYTHKNNSKKSELSNIYLYNSMNKYGIENFKFEVIEKDILISDVNEREMYWIKELNTLKPNGYNLTEGGEGTKGYIMSEKTKSLISEKRKEWYNSLSEDEKEEFKSRLSQGGDLQKMNEGSKRWRENSTEEEMNAFYKRVVETKKEKGYDFYNFSFGKMNEEEKNEMYEKISKNNPRSKSVIMMNIDGEFIKEFHSIGEASRYLNKEYNTPLHSKVRIRKVLDTNGKAYNFKWKSK